MDHKATIVDGSIENLGANGIAFSIVCCGDPKTLERHTIQAAHTLTLLELYAIIEKQYLAPCSNAHWAAEIHTGHVKNLAKQLNQPPDVTECEGCK